MKCLSGVFLIIIFHLVIFDDNMVLFLDELTISFILFLNIMREKYVYFLLRVSFSKEFKNILLVIF